MARFDTYDKTTALSPADTVLVYDESTQEIKQATVETMTEHVEAQVTEYVKKLDFLNAFRESLLACFEHVAWADTEGQARYEALYQALYSTPTSITATFSQGSAVVYDTDSLDSLRQYLTVTIHYAGGASMVTQEYTLSGTLTPGNCTVIVTHGDLSASFIVYVTRNERRITAVFNPGTATILTTDSLDSLKQYLVVTYYASITDTGTVLADSAYTLSGSLAVGTNTITATYGDLTATFTVVAERIYLSNFDFTQSLVDKAGLLTATLAANTGSGHTAPTRDSEGIHFTEATQLIEFGTIDPVGKTFEYDITSLSFAGDTSHHVRLMMHHNGTNGMSPFIWRSGYGWSGYGFSKNSGTTKTWYNSVWSGLGGTDAASINQLSGKTVKLVFESTGESTSTAVSVYINNVLIERKIGLYFGTVGSRNCEQFTFGAIGESGAQDSGDQCFNLTLAGMRIYANEAA